MSGRARIEVGEEFAGHRIERVLGRGGMGVVYLATQLTLGRLVALKVVAPDVAADERFRERFKREAKTVAAIDHPHVIPVHHAGEEDGLLYITMYYADGTDLSELIKATGGLDPTRAARVVAQVAEALDAAHAAGLVHRDVKPGNVLLKVDGEDFHAYLTDFGIAKDASSQDSLTRSGTVVGTLDYIAPEQLDDGPLDARTDVYALGCVLYQALTGEVPYPRDSESKKIFAHVTQPPPRPSSIVPELPAELDDVIARAMAKNPDDRYPSAGDLGRAALAAVGDTPTAPAIATGDSAPTAGTTTTIDVPTGRERRRRARRATAAALILAALAATGLTLALTGGDSDSDGRQAQPPVAGTVKGPPVRLRTQSGIVFAPRDSDTLLSFRQRGGGTVEVIDEASGRVEQRPSSDIDVYFVNETDDAATLWVFGRGTRGAPAAQRIDPGTGAAVGPVVKLRRDAALFGASDRNGLFTLGDTGLERLMPATGERDKIAFADIGVPSALNMFVVNDRVFLCGEDRIAVVDARTLERLTPIDAPLGEAINGCGYDSHTRRLMAFTDGRTGARLRELDPASLRFGREVRVPRDFGTLATDADSLWLNFGDEGRLVRIDRNGGTAFRRLDLGERTYVVATGKQYVWVLTADQRRLIRVAPTPA